MNPREGVWEGQYIILLLPLDYYNILREVFCETKVLRYQTTKRLALAKIVIQHCESKVFRVFGKMLRKGICYE